MSDQLILPQTITEHNTSDNRGSDEDNNSEKVSLPSEQSDSVQPPVVAAQQSSKHFLSSNNDTQYETPTQPSQTASSFKLIPEPFDEIIVEPSESRRHHHNRMHKRMSSSNPLILHSPDSLAPTSSMITTDSPHRFDPDSALKSPEHTSTTVLLNDFSNQYKDNSSNSTPQLQQEQQNQEDKQQLHNQMQQHKINRQSSQESSSLPMRKSRFFQASPISSFTPKNRRLPISEIEESLTNNNDKDDSVLPQMRQSIAHQTSSGMNDNTSSTNERAFFQRKTLRFTSRQDTHINLVEELPKLRQRNGSELFIPPTFQEIESTPKRGGGWNLAFQMKNINRFISKIRDQTSDQNFMKLLPHHLALINDASFQKEGGSKEYFEVSTEAIHRGVSFLQKMPVFDPDGIVLLVFKMIVIFALLIQVFITPVEIGFNLVLSQISAETKTLFKDIPIVLFIMDLIFRLNTGFYQNGTFVQDRSKNPRYFFWMLGLDTMNILGLLLRNTGIFMPVLVVIFICRFSLLYKKCNDVLDHFSVLERYPITYNLTKLIFIFLLVGHVSGCGFHYLTTVESDEISWIEFYNFQNLSITNRYIISIYFSIITMITVGYGDLTPQNQRERLYVIFIVIISGTVFAYTVNMIGQLFQENEKKIAVYKQMKFDITNYLENRFISKKTQLKVYNYLDYINQKANESPEKGQRILSMISENLKNDVYKEFYGQILTNSKLFHNKFSHEFIQKVSLRMEEKMFGPGEIIFHEDTQTNPCLYYILKGKVEMFSKRQEQKHTLGYLNHKILLLPSGKQGDSLGHRCFNASQPQEFSTITSEVTHLVFITQQRFLECLKEFPQDYEIFMMTKENIIFGQNRYMNPCYSCNKMTHTSIECPLIHYTKNRQLCINRYLYSVPEKERHVFTRKRFVKSHSLNNMLVTRDSLKAYRLDLTLAVLQNHPNKQRVNLDFLQPTEESDKKFFKRMCKFKLTNEKLAFSTNQIEIDSEISDHNESTDSSNDEDYDELQYIEESAEEDDPQQQQQQQFSTHRFDTYSEKEDILSKQSPSPTLSKKKVTYATTNATGMPKKPKLPLLRKKTDVTASSKSTNLTPLFRRSKTGKLDQVKKTEVPSLFANPLKPALKFSLVQIQNSQQDITLPQLSPFRTPSKPAIVMQPIRQSQIINIKQTLKSQDDSLFLIQSDGNLEQTERVNNSNNLDDDDNSIFSSDSLFNEEQINQKKSNQVKLAVATQQVFIRGSRNSLTKDSPGEIFNSLLASIKTTTLNADSGDSMKQIQLPAKNPPPVRLSIEEKSIHPYSFIRQNSNQIGSGSNVSMQLQVASSSSAVQPQGTSSHSPLPQQQPFYSTTITTPFVARRVEEFSFAGFEIMKEFLIYFPSFNYGNVLKKINGKIIITKRRRLTQYPVNFQRKLKKKATTLKTAASIISHMKGFSFAATKQRANSRISFSNLQGLTTQNIPTEQTKNPSD